MNTMGLTAAYMRHNWQRTGYNVLLFAIGTALIATVMSLGSRFENSIDRNLHGIDMVVGAKGSPLQLVLSTVFAADVPNGNIALEDARKLEANPMVRAAIPMALGDNYRGYRIVGTTPAYAANYGAQLASGRMFGKSMEAVLGSSVAADSGLHVGEKFAGSHGLSPGGELHSQFPYTVVGVMKPTGTILDRLVLTPVDSVWYVHENDLDDPNHPTAAHREVTALLVKFGSPLAVIGLPRYINKNTTMLAASPAMQAFRLRQLLGVGSDTLVWLGGLLMGLAGLGLLISMAEAVRQRLYDLALMRCLGATPARVVGLAVLEGVGIAVIGGGLGLAASVYGTALAAGSLMNGQLGFAPAGNGAMLAGIFGIVVALGLVGSLLPALRVYRLGIPQLLGSRS